MYILSAVRDAQRLRHGDGRQTASTHLCKMNFLSNSEGAISTFYTFIQTE
jgi:hypothetical protein